MCTSTKAFSSFTSMWVPRRPARICQPVRNARNGFTLITARARNASGSSTKTSGKSSNQSRKSGIHSRKIRSLRLRIPTSIIQGIISTSNTSVYVSNLRCPLQLLLEHLISIVRFAHVLPRIAGPRLANESPDADSIGSSLRVEPLQFPNGILSTDFSTIQPLQNLGSRRLRVGLDEFETVRNSRQPRLDGWIADSKNLLHLLN